MSRRNQKRIKSPVEDDIVKHILCLKEFVGLLASHYMSLGIGSEPPPDMLKILEDVIPIGKEETIRRIYRADPTALDRKFRNYGPILDNFMEGAMDACRDSILSKDDVGDILSGCVRMRMWALGPPEGEAAAKLSRKANEIGIANFEEMYEQWKCETPIIELFNPSMGRVI